MKELCYGARGCYGPGTASTQTLRPQVTHAERTAACVQVAISTVMQIHEQQAPGDILLFLTGKGEIDKVCWGTLVSASPAGVHNAVRR